MNVRRRRYIAAIAPALLLSCLLTFSACERRSSAKRDPALATAYCGPITLNIRGEVNPQSKPVATAKHGEKLEVLQVRRRFVRVRTPSGQEGWTELRNLLSDGQMEDLRLLAKRATKLPSQGEATVYSSLNIHSDPNRLSTSFYQITEGVKVDVVGHQLVPRAKDAPSTGFQVPKAQPRRRTREKKEPAVPPPPRPQAPGLPPNWQALSKSASEPAPEELIATKKRTEKVPVEDWSLVRTKDGKAGWVLTRNLVMAIPDEVAQYSEGARISSYFALKPVQDGDVTKHYWLWTTMRDTGAPYDFDSFRIFIYMLRRHRYETAYIERRVEGYYPVTVTPGDVPKFALITRNDDGNLIRRTFVMEGYNVRRISEEPYQMRPGTPGATVAGKESEEPESTDDPGSDEAPKKSSSFIDRLMRLFRRR